MVKKTAVIRNNMGIHVRPTGVIIQEAGQFDAVISIKAKGMETDLTDHMGLLAMGLCKDDVVEISVEGNHEEQVCEEIVKLLEREFDFPPRP